MARVISFDNKQIIEPGAYAQVLGGQPDLPVGVTSGNTILIDTGANATAAKYGVRAGINGELEKKQDAIYQFENSTDFKRAVGGGLYWDVVDKLFAPGKDTRVQGITSLFYIRAATTTAATITYTFVGGGANGGTLTIKPRTEGLAGNGAENSSSVLTQGFAGIMKAGVIDPAKFIIEFRRGTFKGLDDDGIPFDNIAEDDIAQAELLVQTPEFDNIQEVLDWMAEDAIFDFYFSGTGSAAGDGSVDAADLAANPGNNLAVGGTETFGTTDLDDALEQITELDASFILADRFGDAAQDTENFKLLSHIISQSDFKMQIYIGAGADSTKFDEGVVDGSIETAKAFNSGQVQVCHHNVKVNFDNSKGFKTVNTLYTAAIQLGRAAGQETQEPTTFKDINILGPIDPLSKRQREVAIQKGVMHFRVIDGSWVNNQDIDSKQDNTQDIYADGSSPHGSIMRISNFLNKDLMVNVRKQFTGKTAAIASPEDVKLFIEGLLDLKVATKTDDNILLSYKNITVKLVGSDYFIQYSATPNGPINRSFITGFLLNVELSA